MATDMGRVRDDAFERVVQKFFEAAAAPEVWPDALHELARACGADGAAAHALGAGPPVSVFSAGLAEFYHEYVTRWREPNSHMTRGMALIQRGWRGALTEQDCFTPEELARDTFQQEFYLPNGFSSFAGVMLAQGPDLMLPVSINRRIEQGPYLRSEIALIDRLVMHLRVAGAVAVRVGIESARRMADAYATVGHPVALIGRDGRVLHMNARFEQLIGDGVQAIDRRLGSWQADADRTFQALIGRAVGYDGILREPLTPAVLPRQSDARPLVAQVVPVVGRAHDFLQRVAAIVTLTDLEAAAFGPAETVLATAFGLTPAEARLAARIALGKSLVEITQEGGGARETLRSRLKTVFEKTGTRRQAELVLLLSRLMRP
jgi:DNA-binding CsgD family transcriptional regulator/PAS domain-containing protein